MTGNVANGVKRFFRIHGEYGYTQSAPLVRHATQVCMKREPRAHRTANSPKKNRTTTNPERLISCPMYCCGFEFLPGFPLRCPRRRWVSTDTRETCHARPETKTEKAESGGRVSSKEEKKIPSHSFIITGETVHGACCWRPLWQVCGRNMARGVACRREEGSTHGGAQAGEGVMPWANRMSAWAAGGLQGAGDVLADGFGAWTWETERAFRG